MSNTKHLSDGEMQEQEMFLRAAEYDFDQAKAKLGEGLFSGAIDKVQYDLLFGQFAAILQTHKDRLNSLISKDEEHERIKYHEKIVKILCERI